MMKAAKSSSRTIFEICNYIFLILFTFMCIYPFYYIFIYSISIPQQASQGGLYFLPKGFTLLGYQQILSQNNIWHGAMVSVTRTMLGTVIAVFCTAMFSYVLTHKLLKFRKAIYRLLIMTMYVNAGIIPYYVTMKAYGLKDSLLLYILPGAISAFNLVLVKTYIEQIPASLEESASIDGAGPFRIFVRIIFPLCKPILATIAIFTAVGQWNTWFDNFLLADKPHLETLQYLLLKYISAQSANMASQATNWTALSEVKMTPVSVQMTVTMIVTFPVLIVYPMFQKYFIKGIKIGAVKG